MLKQRIDLASLNGKEMTDENFKRVNRYDLDHRAIAEIEHFLNIVNFNPAYSMVLKF